MLAADERTRHRRIAQESVGPLAAEAGVMCPVMNVTLLEYLPLWVQTKQANLRNSGVEFDLAPVAGIEEEVQYLDLFMDQVAARATVWASGAVDLEVIEATTSEQILYLTVEVDGADKLATHLEWWLGECMKRLGGT